MGDLDRTFEKLDACFDRIERTMFIGFIVISSVWWAGVATTATLILANLRGADGAAGPRERTQWPKSWRTTGTFYAPQARFVFLASWHGGDDSRGR